MPSTIANSNIRLAVLLDMDLLFLEIDATGEVETRPRAIFDLKFLELAVTGTKTGEASAAFDLQFLELEPIGRRNLEANKFGEADLDLPFLELEAIPGRTAIAAADFDLQFLDVLARGNASVADSSELSFVVDIIPPQPTGNYIHQKGRLKIDGIEIPFISAEYSASETNAGEELSIQLARRADKDLLTPTAVIEFGVGLRTGGVWDESTFKALFDSGDIDKTNFSIARQNDAPNDTISFSSIGKLSLKLSKCPGTDLVIYDPLRLTLLPTDFQSIFDTDGREYQTELKAIPGMMLYDLFFEIFVHRCGFSGYKTNLPNFPIQRVDCSFGKSFVEAIAGYIGMFDPDIYETDNIVQIEDGTNILPAGFPAPRAVPISNCVTQAIASGKRRVDALLVYYSEDQRNYDFTTSRSEILDPMITGIFGNPGYTETAVERFFIEYRKFSNPTIVLRSALERETVSVTDYVFEVIHETEEVFTYDDAGRQTGRTKTTRSLLPQLAISPTPIVDMLFTLQTAETENESFEYQTHPFRPREVYLAQHTIDLSGIVAFDTNTPQAGKDYYQGIIEAYRSGNITDGSVIVQKPIKSFIETAQPQSDGTVKTRTIDIDHLRNVVSNDIGEDRAGDVGLSGLTSRQNRVLVFDADNADRSLDRVEDFHAGELPVIDAIALARRVLKKRKTKPNTATLSRIGYDEGIRKGSAITATERQGVSLGAYKIKGLTITISRTGVFMTLNGKQI